MKKALIILEQHFIKCKDEVYVDVQCNQKFWDRYLDVYDKICVVGRMSENSNVDFDKLLLTSRDNVEFFGLPEFSGINGLAKNWGKCNANLKNAIKYFSPDVIIFRCPSPITLCLQKTIINSKVPYALELMMNPKTAYSYTATGSKFTFIMSNLMNHHTKKIIKYAKGISYVTQESLQKLYPASSKQITATYSTIKLQTKDFKYNSVDLKEIVFAHSAKLADYRKGTDIYLKMLKLFKDNGLKFKAYIIGDGVKKNEMEQLCKKLDLEQEVIFTGWIAGYEKMSAILQKCHFFVFPSKAEGLPRSVIEAMANGCLPVCSCVDGIPELLEEECLVKEFDENKYFNKVNKLIQNKELYESKRYKAFEKSKEFEDSILQKNRHEFYSAIVK